MTSRRNFIKTSAAIATGISTGLGTGAAELFQNKIPGRTIHAFTKCLQFLNYNEIAEVLAKYGFDGADLTVRPGGQVLPENVKKDLPAAMKALRNAGIRSDMIVTNVNDPEHQYSRPILSTMADLGIRYYRMGYLSYDPKKSVTQNLEDHKITFEKLEKLNREYGVTGNYQNHSGTRVGGPVWDLYELLKERDSEWIGVQYDIRHATVEGGVSWPVGMKLLAPWIRTTDIKDFIWMKNDNGEWKLKNVPLGQGMVDFNAYLKLYKELDIKAPVSIHYEYDLGGAERGDKEITIPREKVYSALKNDISFLKKEFTKYNLQ